MLPLSDFPVLKTPRLVLREMLLEDKEDIFRMQADPRMCEHSDSRPETEISGTEEYIERMAAGIHEGNWLIWAIENIESQRVIGTVCIWNFSKDKKIAELGYGIIPECRGKGLMKEALNRIIEFSFKDLKLEALDAYTEENNHSSIGLLKSCSFIDIDKVVDEGFYSNRNFTMVVFRLNTPIINN